MIRRRFVNLVVKSYKSGMYSLHRLDVSKHLFYPSTAEAQTAAAAAAPAPRKKHGNGGGKPQEIPRLDRLPPPCMSFQPSATAVSGRPDPDLPLFALVSPRRGEGRILSCNKQGNSLLYDADSNSTHTMPTMDGYTGVMTTAISASRPGAVEDDDDLYVLHRRSFHVLRRSGSGDREVVWHWDRLPPPPIIHSFRSTAVIDGGRTICVSSWPVGTYCFDTVEQEWRFAGYWQLPFIGGVEYVPQLELWLGFSPTKPHHLCATSELISVSAAMEQPVAMDQPPEVQHVLEGLDTPKNWFVTRFRLLNLGGGRFCVAKVFQEVVMGMDTEDEWEDLELNDFITHDMDSLGDEFAVLTGVELVTGGGSGDDNKREGLQIVVHKSVRYMFNEDMIRWEL